jgi:uncharacterized membrane protein YfcA
LAQELPIQSLSTVEIVYCCVVIVLAYAARGSTGFGAAAAMPLLGLVIPLKILIPVWTLIGLSAGVTLLGRDRKDIAWRAMIGLLPGCLVGIAIGLYVFKSLDAGTLARAFGVAVLSYGVYSLWMTFRPPAKWNASGPVAATLAGLLGGAVGTTFGTMASLFFAIYLDALKLAKEHFRATMSAMILVLSAMRGIGYYVVGEFSTDAWVAFAAAFPLMLLGVFIGDRFHADMSETTFKRLVAAILIISGVALLVK